jgi:hypothetical protein
MEQVLEHLLREKGPVQAAIPAPGALAGEACLGPQAGAAGVVAADHRIEGDSSQPAKVVGVDELRARARALRDALDVP